MQLVSLLIVLGRICAVCRGTFDHDYIAMVVEGIGVKYQYMEFNYGVS